MRQRKKSSISIRFALLFGKIVRIEWQLSLTVRTHLLVLIGDAHEKGGRADRAEFAGRLVVFYLSDYNRSRKYLLFGEG